MPRGENHEFKSRVGELSMPLKRRNVERKLRSDYPELKMDLFDVEAYLTEDECFSTIWSSIEAELEDFKGKKWSDMSKAELDNLIEKYEAIQEEHQKEEITVTSSGEDVEEDFTLTT